MNVSEIVAARHPHIHGFIEQILDMQFGDVRAMLQLPRPGIGIRPACNFAIAGTLCSLISGISTTIFMPPNLHGQSEVAYGSGTAFRELMRDFFPLKHARLDIPEFLLELCRNPLAHSAGIANRALPRVSYTRVFHGEHPEEGWTDKELDDLERKPEMYRLPHHSIQVQGDDWTVHCDCFYFDVIAMLRKLVADRAQADSAETRFSQGAYVWRKAGSLKRSTSDSGS